MVLVDEIDIFNKKERKRLKKQKFNNLLKDLGLLHETDKLYQAEKIKYVYRERLKKFTNLIARFRDKRAIKRISKHLREVKTIYYEIEEESIDFLKGNFLNSLEISERSVCDENNQKKSDFSVLEQINYRNLLNNLSENGAQKNFSETEKRSGLNLADSDVFSFNVDAKYITFDEIESLDNRSVMSQVNKLADTKKKSQRFFGKSTNDIIESNQVSSVCIYGNIRNLEISKDDCSNEVVFISPEGTEFTKKDVYWVRRFQNAWRLRQFKALTMKICREQMNFRKQKENAAKRRAFKKVLCTKEQFRPESSKKNISSKGNAMSNSKTSEQEIFESKTLEQYDSIKPQNFFSKIKNKFTNSEFFSKENEQASNKSIKVTASNVEIEDYKDFEMNQSETNLVKSMELPYEYDTVSFSNRQR